MLWFELNLFAKKSNMTITSKTYPADECAVNNPNKNIDILIMFIFFFVISNINANIKYEANNPGSQNIPQFLSGMTSI